MPLTKKKESKVAPTMGAGGLDESCKRKMYRSVVYIETNSKYGAGTGSIVSCNDSLPWLLTCQHVILSEKIAKKCTIHFDWESSAQRGTSVLGSDLFDSSRYFITWPSRVGSESEEPDVKTLAEQDLELDLELDCSLIPLKASAIPGDKRDYLSLDQYLNLKSHALKEKDLVHLFHYPGMSNKRLESSYLVKFLEGYLIGHEAETDCGSSGCPVLKEVDQELVLVGMHTGSVMEELMGIKQEVNIATNIEEIHKFCTTPGYTLPAIDEQKVQRTLHKDEPRKKALRKAHETLKIFYTEPIKPKKPGKVDKFVNLSLIEHPPHLYREKKDVQEVLDATACGIDRYFRKAKNFTYGTILTCTMNDSGKRVVIVGSPGSGKSTLARKLCRDLYSGHLPNQYQLVLFAELKAFRVYLKRVNKAEPSLLTLLEYLGGLSSADNLCSIVEEEAGRNVAVILDGFDEISDDKPLSSWVFQLFSRNIQCQRMRKQLQCDMFITTRPSQLAQLTEAAESLVEVLGFLSSDIEHYIKAYFADAPDRADKVIHSLHSLPLVHGLCSNPRILEITCKFIENLDEEPLPENLSGMFLWYIRYQLEADLMQRDPPIKMRIRNLLDVPQDLFPGFYALCRLAYQCCWDQQLLLEEEELEKEEILKYVDKQGSLYHLLFTEPVLSPSQIPCVLYQSDHKTVTEALAAVHIAVLPQAEQQQIWQEQFTVPHMAHVWMMYCGLTGLKSVDLRRLSSLSVSERGREVVNHSSVAIGALKDEDMLLMVSLHEANNSEESKHVLPAVLKNTIRATIKSHYDAMVVGNAITHHPNLQTVDLNLDKGMSEIDLQSLNAKNVKFVRLSSFSVTQIQAVLPQDVEEVALEWYGAKHSIEEFVDALRAYQCLHSLDLTVDLEENLDSVFDSLSSRLTGFRLYHCRGGLDVSVESLQNVLVPREKCSLNCDLPLTSYQLSAVLAGLRRADKLKELHLYWRSAYSEVSPNQWLISSAEVEELVATHPQLVKVDVGKELNDLLLAVAKGAIKNKNIAHLGLGKYLSLAVLPLLRSPSADHITSVRARVDFSTRPDDGEWTDLLLGGVMARPTCHLIIMYTLDVVTVALLGALLSRVHTVPKLTDLSITIWGRSDDDQTPVDVPGVEAAFRVCQLKKLRITHSFIKTPSKLYPLYCAVLCGIAANSTAQVDTCIYGHRSVLDVDKLTGQLPQQTLERFEVVKTASGYFFIIFCEAACPSVPAPTPYPLLPMPQAVNLTPGNVLTEQDPPTKPVTPPPDQAPLSEPPPGSTQPGSEDAQRMLYKYKARLLSEEMNAKAVSTRLKNKDVISAKLFSQLSKQDTTEEANDLLFAHLRGQATLVSLQSFSRVLVEVGKEGYARMKVLGKELLAELDQLLPAPSSSLPS